MDDVDHGLCDMYTSSSFFFLSWWLEQDVHGLCSRCIVIWGDLRVGVCCAAH